MTTPSGLEYATITLTQGKVGVVDSEDFKRVSNRRWHAQWNPRSKTFYAAANVRGEDGKYKMIHLHREIMAVTDPKMDVNHWDHDGLNCRKENLVICTRSQNAAYGKMRTNNTSGYKGVFHQGQCERWKASICHQGKHIYIGLFVDKIEAARAYDRKAIELFGDFVHLNFPRSDYA